MPSLKWEDLEDENIRIKISEKADKELWNLINQEYKNINHLSNEISYSTSKIYNWKNKDVFYPLEFLKNVLELQNVKNKKLMIKGPGKSKKWGLKLPLSVNNELLTRINLSVKVNKEGTPIYITRDKGLVTRFRKLLEELNVEFKIHRNQGRYELTYPKYIHKLLTKLEFEEDITAKADEIGEVQGNKIIFPDSTPAIKLTDLGELHSEEKKLQKALITGESQEVEEIIRKQVGKVRNVLK